ncbi:hypothetical protein [Cylindrospermopsis raciborskii]|uniref:hypothetical protein n=1 Tax=Cylindrospermopsis raciborskii TaxID=77022 RepID=UPI0015E0A2F5|nr:hypothetical protein [Cylindrospermopsis raciborskii]
MRHETQQTNQIYINAIALHSLRELAKYSLQEIAKLGLKAQVGLKPTSFVVGNRRLG